MKHNVLFLVSRDTMTGGGAEEIMRLIAMYHIKNGDEVHIFFLLEKRFGHWEELKASNLHLHYSKGGGKWGIFSIIHNFWKERKTTFDYSFSSIVECTGILGILRRLRIIKIKHMVARESTMVFDRFSGNYLLLLKSLYKFGYPAVDILICQTEVMKRHLTNNLPWLEKKTNIVIIPNPVNLDEIETRAKEKIDLTEYSKYLCAAGRLHPVKGYDVLIQALNQASKDENFKDFHLVILGEGPDRKKLEDLSESLGIRSRVHLIGEVSNVYPYFKGASVCVVSSHIEGFPNVLLQMMSQNDRVVCTTCAGGVDEIAGLITCKPSDVNSLEEAIISCLNNEDSDKRRLFDEELNKRDIKQFVKKIQIIAEKQ